MNATREQDSYVSRELTHFVGRALSDDRRYELLKDILRTGWLRPSHRDELGPGFTGLSDGRAALSGNEAIKSAMVCLCDIPVKTLRVHMQKYGPFGIAFPKTFLLRFGATPVFYIATNASHRGVGIGPPTIAAWFDQFRQEIQRINEDLGNYVSALEGKPLILAKLPPRGTLPGHRLMGQLSAIQTELEFLVFAKLKFFKVGLSEEDPDNFYMEREWRVPEGFAFLLTDLARVIVPRAFAPRLREDVKDYTGELVIAEEI